MLFFTYLYHLITAEVMKPFISNRIYNTAHNTKATFIFLRFYIIAAKKHCICTFAKPHCHE